MGLSKYLKRAFLYHWNLLAFAGGMGFALLSGRPDILAPVVLAAEVAYLGLLGTHPKFQKYVEAQEAKAARDQGDGSSVSAEQNLQRILQTLPRPLVQRFETLRNRCVELRQIAQQIRDPHQFASPRPLEELQLAGLDRLLWIYLRLLYTQHMLERFFQSTSEKQILQDIKNLEQRIAAMEQGPDVPQRQRVRQTLEGALETSRTRLANFQKAQHDSELVQAQIESLEHQIRSISEQAIHRHEPEFLSTQVNQAVDSMMQTEQTMNELQFATGLHHADRAIPAIIPRGTPAREPIQPGPEPDEPRRRTRQREDEIRFL